jgi:hypothetical protein
MNDFIFVVLLDIPAQHEAEFNKVYDTDHLLHMTKVPGVRDCTRYKLQWSDNADMLAYLALYHIADPELPRSADWKKQSSLGRWPTEIRQHVTGRSNGVYRQIFHAAAKAAPGKKDSIDSDNIYFLQQSIPADLDGKFNELYNTDHIPLMLQTPGVDSCTRYKLEYSESGGVPDYLAVYAIDTVDRPRTPEWKKQTGLGAWPTQMRPNFTARRNGVYHRLGVFTPK